MIKNTIVRVIMGLCGLLLVAAVTPLNARDAALPPGADFQAGIQGASAHHREKRSLRGGIKAAITILARQAYLKQARRMRRISIERYNKGTLFCTHAETRLALSLSCKDPRMTDSVALNIIKYGDIYLDQITNRIVFVLENDGAVIMLNPVRDNAKLGTVLTLLVSQNA
ncbi:MAG: hypothetical protein ABW165_16955, partial [Candidatus Thiodiazotropha sp.]